MFDLHQQRPEPIIPRRRRFTVPGRLGVNGSEIAPLDEAAARELARKIKAMDISSVAICFLNAYVHPQHEERMRDILLDEHPDCLVAPLLVNETAAR